MSNCLPPTSLMLLRTFPHYFQQMTMWTLISSTPLLALLFIGLSGNAVEHPDWLTDKTIQAICNLGATTFCPATNTNDDPDNVCSKMADDSHRLNHTDSSALCESGNTCSFLAAVNNSYNSYIYVSYKTRCQESIEAGGRVYKTCNNGLVIYSLYP